MLVEQIRMSALQLIMQRGRGILLDKNPKRGNVLQEGLSADTNVWHAFILCTRAKMNRNQLLELIINYVRPYPLIPHNFEKLGSSHSGSSFRYMFIARDCNLAIQKIYANKLTIYNPYNIMLPIDIEIVLQYSTTNEIRVSVADKVKPILYSLYTSSTRLINLDSFAENEVLSDYLPLSEPSILYQTIGVVASYNPFIIRLRNNGIESLSSQDNFWKCTNLQLLDLRNNKISNITAFEGLEGLKLIEIYLDGNPICDTMDAYTYVSELKNIFPCLVKIDGELIVKDGVPAFKRTFLCDLDGFNVLNKFVDTYFFRYDKDRNALMDLYHPDALWSMTFAYKIGQTTSNDARLRPYQVNARNLLSMADVTRSHQFLIRGNQNIVRKLIDLPQLEHDTFSFSVDLIYHSEKVSIINICGVFREFPESILTNERHLGFIRTFHLRNYSGDYFITNDMLHVYNALSTQVSRAFKITCSKVSPKLPIARTPREKEKAVEAFKTVTGLTNDWSKRLLEDYGYNVIDCVKYFMDMYKVDKIPPTAFEERF